MPASNYCCEDEKLKNLLDQINNKINDIRNNSAYDISNSLATIGAVYQEETCFGTSSYLSSTQGCAATASESACCPPNTVYQVVYAKTACGVFPYDAQTSTVVCVNGKVINEGNSDTNERLLGFSDPLKYTQDYFTLMTSDPCESPKEQAKKANQFIQSYNSTRQWLYRVGSSLTLDRFDQHRLFRGRGHEQALELSKANTVIRSINQIASSLLSSSQANTANDLLELCEQLEIHQLNRGVVALSRGVAYNATRGSTIYNCPKPA